MPSGNSICLYMNSLSFKETRKKVDSKCKYGPRTHIINRIEEKKLIVPPMSWAAWKDTNTSKGAFAGPVKIGRPYSVT